MDILNPFTEMKQTENAEPITALPKPVHRIIRKNVPNGHLPKKLLRNLSGKEAIGIVISEFGNIDELMSELNVTPITASTDIGTVSVSREEASHYISVKK